MKFVVSDEVSPYITDSKEFYLVPELMTELGTENCFSQNFDPDLLNYACYNSFFPMAGRVDDKWALILKLHKERCIINFDNYKVPKKVKKIASNYKLTFNKEFDKCIEMINKRYDNSWLVDPLIDMFKNMQNEQKYKIKFCSFELWDEEKLVAGEVGFVIGTVYSSLSGFHTISNTGHVQLYLTNIFLKDNGFSFWDLGMELDYKMKLGGEILSTDEFYAKYEEVRDDEMDLSKL